MNQYKFTSNLDQIFEEIDTAIKQLQSDLEYHPSDSDIRDIASEAVAEALCPTQFDIDEYLDYDQLRENIDREFSEQLSSLKDQVDAIVDQYLDDFSQKLFSLKEQVDAIEQVIFEHTKDINLNGERYWKLSDQLKRKSWKDRVKGWFAKLTG